MNLPVKFAFRYLFSRKMSLVNIISLISVFGVAGMTAALIVILSVFNGFDSLIQSMMNQFDPDIKVSASQGKTFKINKSTYQALNSIDNVKIVMQNIEETALFQYEHYQYIATIKGVETNYDEICNIKNCTYIGQYLLKDQQGISFALVGNDIAGNLTVNINGFTPLKIYAPRRTEKVSMNPADAFSHSLIVPSGIFHIHQDFDSKYVIVPIDFARNLLEYDSTEVSSLEIACHDYTKVAATCKQIKEILGGEFQVKDRYQQQDMLYKIMQSEKMSIIVMLSFIIIIASFNIIGALTMLIIDKRKDIITLTDLGADSIFIRKIFANTGRLITLTGAIAGIIIGLLICWIQIQFHVITFPEGSFIIDYYPVEVRFWDIVVTTIIVTIIGFVAAVIPTRKIGEM